MFRVNLVNRILYQFVNLAPLLLGYLSSSIMSPLDIAHTHNFYQEVLCALTNGNIADDLK